MKNNNKFDDDDDDIPELELGPLSYHECNELKSKKLIFTEPEKEMKKILTLKELAWRRIYFDPENYSIVPYVRQPYRGMSYGFLQYANILNPKN